MDFGGYGAARSREPVCLLSLDGGGIRGISEAVILHEIMTRLQKACGLSELPKPCDHFHLIGGTSTGGLMAIMLGRLRMSTQEVIDEYEKLAKQVFRKKHRRFDGSFRESILESCIKEAVKSRDCGTHMLDVENGKAKGLAFVVAVRKGGDENTPALFRTYESYDETWDCEIWEAARATTAAPFFFKPAELTLEDGTQTFIDGAVKWNNPSKLVLEEAKSHFGEQRHLGCLVSLGTGLRPNALDPHAKGHLGLSYNIAELKRMTSDFLTDPEPPHLDIKSRLEGYPQSYFRFSLPCSEKLGRIRIHDYKKMPDLRRETENYLRQGHVSMLIDDVVGALKWKRNHKVPLKAVCHTVPLSTSADLLDHLLENRKPTPIFTGRDAILERMSTLFSPRGPTEGPRRDFWLWGIGGVGKTQIALRFIEQSKDQFAHVFWIDASDDGTIHQSIQNMAKQIFQSRIESLDSALVVSWLQNTDEDWLIVVDNYDNGDISPHLPNFERGNIIFTSRRVDLPPRGPIRIQIKVLEMDVEDSTTLLLRAAHLDSQSEELRAQSERLVEELGFLPLALDQAGSFLSIRGCSIPEYLDKLRTQKVDLLDNPLYKGAVLGNRGVYASFDLTVDYFLSSSRKKAKTAWAYRSALQILNTFCFYHHEGLTFDITAIGYQYLLRPKNFKRLAPALDASWGTLSKNDVGIQLSRTFLGMSEAGTYDYNLLLSGVEILMQFAIFRMEPKSRCTFSMHPLVHSWARDRMTPAAFKLYHQAARLVLFSPVILYPTTYHENLYARLLPHMRAIRYFNKQYDEDISFRDKTTMDLKFSVILNRSGLWEESVAVLEQILKERIYEYDRNDSSVLKIMIYLAREYRALSQWGKAEELLREVSERLVMCPRQDFTRQGIPEVNLELAVIHLYHMNFTLARQSVERAIAATRQDPFYREYYEISIQQRLSLICQYQLRWKDAEAHSENVIKAYMATPFDEYLILRARRELSFIHIQLGRAAAAERTLVNIAEALEAAFGSSHLDVLMAKADLAWALFKQEKYVEAEEILSKILATARATLGNKNLYTLTIIFRLGLTMACIGNFGEPKRLEGKALIKEAFEGRQEVLMPCHVAVEGVRVWLVTIMHSEMEELYREQPHRRDPEEIEKMESWETNYGGWGRAYAELPFSFTR